MHCELLIMFTQNEQEIERLKYVLANIKQTSMFQIYPGLKNVSNSDHLRYFSMKILGIATFTSQICGQQIRTKIEQK